MGKVTDTTGPNKKIIELNPPPCFIILFARYSSNPAEQAIDVLFSCIPENCGTGSNFRTGNNKTLDLFVSFAQKLPRKISSSAGTFILKAQTVILEMTRECEAVVKCLQTFRLQKCRLNRKSRLVHFVWSTMLKPEGFYSVVCWAEEIYFGSNSIIRI